VYTNFYRGRQARPIGERLYARIYIPYNRTSIMYSCTQKMCKSRSQLSFQDDSSNQKRKKKKKGDVLCHHVSFHSFVEFEVGRAVFHKSESM
jgi:hypothetical protein